MSFVHKFSLLFFLILPEIARAQDGAGPAPSPGETFMRMIPMFVIVFFIFYFLVIRPQEKRLRAHQALLGDLKKGTQVVTSGGIIGRVATVESDHVTLEVANNVKVRFHKENISRLYESQKAGPAAHKKKGKAA